MSNLRTWMMGVVFWVLLSPANVFAQSHNHEGHHQNEVASPFEAKKENPSLHCLLKFHTQHGYCPHSNSVKDKSVPVTIASDCGGKTTGALPKTVSLNYDFTEEISVPQITNDLKSAFISNQIFSYHRFNDSLSPPPKII